MLQSFAFAQVIVLPDTGENALPDPPEFIYVQREPSPMVAGQPYSLSWETQGGGAVTYSCTSSSGGYTIGTTSVSGKGTLSGTANAAWIGKPSNCVWRVKNAGGEDVVYEDMITVAAPLVNKATFVSQNVPTTMLAGQSYRIQITMQNTGTTTWQAGVWKLGSQNPMETPRWSLTRVALASNVAPGASNTFDFTVTAPTTPGVANLQWGMVQEGEAWFGATSTNVAVNVVAAKNDAAVVSQSVPTSMVAGQIYPVSVTMKNTGTTTWAAGIWKLGAQNPMDTLRWGLQRVELPGNIAPNGSATFNFNVTAPATAGVANMQWAMVQESQEWFGAMTTNVGVTVSMPPSTDPTITVTREANPMTAGKTTQLSWTSTNAITVARVCTSTGTGYTDSSTLKLNDSVAITASASWIGFPSSCIWTATASSGKTAKVTENDIVTLAAPPTLPLPTIAVTRSPNPMVAGRDFTLKWSTTNTATLTRKCSTAVPGGFVSDGAMVLAAIDATNSTGSFPAAKADAVWVGKPSSCTWIATSKEGKTKEFTETMITDAAPTGPQITYIHTDGLGSPVARTDEKGNVVSRTRYEPYGATAGGTTPTIGFTGHVNDADTGLTYMQQRYYDPVAGRFMSVDPVLTDINSGASFNRYVYANNSPYKYIDPDGRFSTEDCKAMGGNCTTIGGSNLSAGAKTGAVLGAAAGYYGGAALGGVLAGACDVASDGVCIPANPAIVIGTQAIVASGGAVAGAYIGDKIEKAWDQLDNLITKAAASTGGPTEYQYALVATAPGLYPNVRGGLVPLAAGDVWKYGATVDPGGRYSPAALANLNLSMVRQAQGNHYQVLASEKIQLITYATIHRTLPPGNRIFK